MYLTLTQIFLTVHWERDCHTVILICFSVKVTILPSSVVTGFMTYAGNLEQFIGARNQV
jgi:hypothetical protein